MVSNIVRNLKPNSKNSQNGSVTEALYCFSLLWLALCLSACRLDGNEIKGSLGGHQEPPATVTNLKDGSFSNLTTSSPTISWDQAPEEEHISHYLVAIGSTAGGIDVLDWQQVTTNSLSSLAGLSLSHGSTYYVSVKSVNSAGLESSVAISDGWLVDTEVPSGVSSVLDGVSLDTLGASTWLTWTGASDSDSGIDHYEISIGTGSGLSDVLTWTPHTGSLQTQLAGLNLTDSQTYYPQIRAVDGAGNKSVPVIGDGWTTAKPKSLLNTNDTVKEILDVGNTRYISGNFTHVGSVVGRLAQLNSDGSLDSGTPWPDFNGKIHVMISDGAGGYYIGGDFSEVAGQERLGLARVNSDGSLHSFKVDIGSTTRSVRELVLDGSLLYSGGSFDSIDGETRTGLGSYNISTETVTAWDPNPRGGYWDADAPGIIYTMIKVGTTLYVGGRFLTIGGQARESLASFDNTGALNSLSIDPTNSLWDAPIYDIEYNGGNLYLGGKFSEINSTNRYGAGAVDATTGILQVWNPVTGPSTAAVSKILLDGANAYIGGYFGGVVGCTFCDNIGHVDLNTGNSTAGGSGWMLAFHMASLSSTSGKPLNDMALIGTTLYASHAHSSSPTGVTQSATCKVTSNYFLAIDTTSGIPINFFAGVGNEVTDIEVIGTDILIGGDFRTAGGTLRSGMAAFDLTTGNLLPFDPMVCDTSNNDAWVNSFDYDGGYIYLGGRFENVNGDTLRTNLARVDATTGVVDASWSADTSGDVLTVKKIGSNIYVGGNYLTIDGLSRSGLARLELPTANVGTWVADITATSIRHILEDSGTIYLFGDITQAGGNPIKHVAAVSETDGSALAWDPQIDDGLRTWDAFIDNNIMYIGGHFSSVQGSTRQGFAAVDLATANLLPLELGISTSVIYKTTKWNNDYVIIQASSGKSLIYNFKTGQEYLELPDFSGHVAVVGNTLMCTKINGGISDFDLYFNPIDIFTGQRH